MAGLVSMDRLLFRVWSMVGEGMRGSWVWRFGESFFGVGQERDQQKRNGLFLNQSTIDPGLRTIVCDVSIRKQTDPFERTRLRSWMRNRQHESQPAVQGRICIR